MFDIEKLSIPAKAEAMRYGHSAVVNQDEIVEFLHLMTPFLQEQEHFAVVPLGSLVGTIQMYSVKITPVLKVKASGSV